MLGSLYQFRNYLIVAIQTNRSEWWNMNTILRKLLHGIHGQRDCSQKTTGFCKVFGDIDAVNDAMRNGNFTLYNTIYVFLSIYVNVSEHVYSSITRVVFGRYPIDQLRFQFLAV